MTGNSPDLPAVSVVVVTLNGVSLLRNCLRSLCNQSYPAVETIVVDNGSTEDVRGMLAAEFPEVHCLRLEENAGFAGGNNRGIRVARGKYIALMNNDAVADVDWIASLVAVAEEDPSVGAAASLVIDGNNPAVLDSCGVGIALDGMSRQAMRGVPLRTVPTTLRSLTAFSGCACLIRAAALEQSGLFDQRFFAYCEDTDLSLRILRAGWRIVAVPGARVTHYYSRTWGAFSLRKVFWVERNHYWVAVKNFPVGILILLPVFTLWRFVVLAYASVRGRGGMDQFLGHAGFLRTAAAMVRANAAALAGLPYAWRARTQLVSPNAMRPSALRKRLFANRLSVAEIILGPREAEAPASTREAPEPATENGASPPCL